MAASVGLAAVLGGPYACDTISSWLGAEPGAGGADGIAWSLLWGACCAPRMCSRNLRVSTKDPSVPIGQPTSYVQPTACFRSMQLGLEHWFGLVLLTPPAGAKSPIVQMQERADAAFSEVQHELVWSDSSGRAPALHCRPAISCMHEHSIISVMMSLQDACAWQTAVCGQTRLPA